MYLKALKIQGFKSFPDPITIDFHPGITGIVGPNGSGKSNISDAILWVLGEQSSRSLRASKMSEVIFNGTESRRQMGYAQVSIVFDNQSQTLPIAYEEVELTRRYYRTGESEYLINNTKCRLKDITELLADTGLGRDGYSVIGQGRVDEVLSDKAEDRRRVFDEAAGIVKYKLRKQESERKLANTEQNLARIDDVLGEVGQRLKPLSKQAEKTRRYNALTREMLNLDVGLALVDIDSNQKKRELYHKNYDQLQADLTTGQALKQKLTRALEEAYAGLHDLDAELDQKRQDHNRYLADLAEQNEKRVASQERVKNLIDQAGKLKLEKDRLLAENQDGQDDLLQNQVKRQELAEVYQAGLAAESKVQEAFNACRTEVRNLQAGEQELRTQLSSKREEIFSLQNQLVALQSLSQADQENKARSDQESVELSDLLVTNRERLEEDQKALQLAVHRLEKSKQDQILSQDKTKTLKADREALLVDLRGKQGLLANTEYRLATLERLEANREGYHFAVKSLMEAIRRGGLSGQGVLGPVGQQISLETQYSLAVETALGPAIHNMITETRSDAVRLIEWLKRERAGRETFLPLDVIRGRSLPAGERDRYGSYLLAVASEVVSCPPEIRPVVDYLLGRVLLAEDMQAALKLSDLCQHRYKIVSLDGDQINAGGSMTGGRDKRGMAGLLSRAAEIQEAKQTIDRVTGEIEDLDKTLSQLAEDIGLAEAYDKNLQDQLLAEEKAVLNYQISCRQLEEDLLEFNRRQARMANELAAKAEAETARNQKVIGIQEELDKARLNLSQEEQSLSEKQAVLAERAEQLEELSQQLSEHTKDNSKLQAELNNLIFITDHADQAAEKNRQRLAAIEQESADNAASQEKLNKFLAQVLEQVDLLNQSVAEASKQEADLETVRNTLQDKQKDLVVKIQDQGNLIADLQLKLERLDQQIAGLDRQDREIKNRLWERYDLSFAQALEMEVEIPGIDLARKQLRDFRKEINALGNINHAAIEEYSQEQDRFNFISGQRADIEGAKQDLLSVIEDLEAEMSNKFKQEFAVINENFSQVFHDLFAGGYAELSLSDDRDLLNCGIEIKAQPPGKRLQSLSLLSGGERSLTAIALVFAIFKLRPAAFCILDEVESALDEANVLRFTDYIGNYTSNSQFILITHRKATMQAANRLYGVTMRERGVSEILSVELTD